MPSLKHKRLWFPRVCSNISASKIFIVYSRHNSGYNLPGSTLLIQLIPVLLHTKLLFIMSWSTHSRNAVIGQQEGGWFLYADLATGGSSGNVGGGWNRSHIRLDDRIGNSNGELVYNSADFSKFSQDVKLDGSKLRAKLATGDSREWAESILDTNDFISNKFGVLTWV